MSYKKWLKILFALFMIGLLCIFIIGYIVHDKFPNDSLAEKEYLIKEYHPTIVFGGDSRAERQLNPIEAKKILKTDNDIINIATSAGDSLMTEYLIDKYPNKFKDAILILSVSANQINDNAISLGAFSYSMISKLSYIDQLKIFIPKKPITLIKYYLHNIKIILKILISWNHINNKFEDTLGFHGVTGILKSDKINIELELTNPLYLNYSDAGIKYILLDNSLQRIKKKVKKLYVYTAPFSPKYIEIIKPSILYKYEISFKKLIKKICVDNDISYKNYLVLEELKDQHFYDTSHLNKEGSKIFTKIVLKDFNIE